MPEVLLEQLNPHGNVQAVVEVDDRACFFYLYGSPDSGLGTKSVWVRNLRSAPAQIDVAGMQAGQPPMNPAEHCRNAGADIAPEAADLSVVWLPEGNGAALFERGRMIAAIPPWSGVEGFHGYSAAGRGEGPLAWAMPTDAHWEERFMTAEEFWNSWSSNPWPAIRDAAMARIEGALGTHSNYYAIDGGNWPPRALIRIPMRDRVALVTIGMGLLPQPNIEMYVDDPQPLRRIELGVLLPSSWKDGDISGIGSWISGQAQLPWSRFTWLGQGHTLECTAWRSPQFTAAVLLSEHPGAPHVPLPPIGGDPVSVLWLVPITRMERQLAMQNGSESVLGKLSADRWRES